MKYTGEMKDSIDFYKPKLDGEVRDPFFKMAEELGFYTDQPGMHYGKPAAVQLLNSIGHAMRANPTAVANALRSLGISGTGPPPQRE